MPTNYTSPAAMEIAARYAYILEEMGVDQTQLEKQLEPFDWWLQATAPGLSKPKSNRLLGYSRVPARQLLQDLTHSYKRKTKNGGEGSSTKGSTARRNIPNEVFSKVVSGVFEVLKNNLDAYQRQLDDEQIDSLTEAALSIGDPAGRNEFSYLISQEAVEEDNDSETTLEVDYTDESDADADSGVEANGDEENMMEMEQMMKKMEKMVVRLVEKTTLMLVAKKKTRKPKLVTYGLNLLNV